MRHPTIINQSDKLPDLDQLLTFLSENPDVEIRYNELPENYIFELTYNLPSFTVHNRMYDKTIFIIPGMHNDKILEKKIEFYECARQFRQDAHRLMQELCFKFDINVATLDGLGSKQFRIDHGYKGQLTQDWTYHLHGAECRFENIMTGQIVEVIIVTRPEFGYLDGYFLFTYMTTTEQFKYLAAWFDNDHSNIYKAIDLLSIDGILTRSVDSFLQRNVIAL